MSRSIPDKLKEKQEQQKKDTVKKIEEAIGMLKDLGYGSVTIANLISETGLARSTFSKPHVEEVLKKHKIGKYKEVKTLVMEQENKYTREYVASLEKQLRNANIKINKLESELASITNKLKQEQLNYVATDLKNRELADKFQRMYDRVIAAGVEVIL
ncbi:DUF6262 family protein [Clostridium perfringens]|uniref:DUF6262 family protein n=1 Tax=Clostridium perfringens TaxID=1502 RepID=UPI002AC62DDB|nr:DUF6262 family protein [Clostridium perfringens]MDK0792668.1 DUF6262 family protein [Clostridium perfringens]MDZ4954504.1 hypothetical protein [Clostridium perfringens]